MERIMSNIEVIKTLILTYKGYPCLWKNDIKYYTSKTQRDKAYEHLLSIYKKADPFASLLTLKKKLGNMRSTYRREYKKVLDAKSKGVDYVPILWYYPYFSFIDSHNDTLLDNILDSDEEITTKQESEDNDSNEGNTIDEVYVKNEAQDSPVYTNVEVLESDEDVEFIIEQDIPGTSACELQTHSNIKDKPKIQRYPKSEFEYFGRTIGLQLQELSKLQKSIAEKLISEVIFYGRLNKLNADSVISLD